MTWLNVDFVPDNSGMFERMALTDRRSEASQALQAMSAAVQAMPVNDPTRIAIMRGVVALAELNDLAEGKP